MLIIFLRAVLLYASLVVTVRVMGKRQIGQMEPSEFVVTMLLANLAAIPLEDPDVPLLDGIIPIVVVFAAELLIAWLTTVSIPFRKLFCGKPEILIDNGKICLKALRKNRINLDELTMHLREKEIFDISEVKFAILETNGQLSTLVYAKNRPASAKDAGQRVRETELPVTLISDGRILKNNLSAAKRSEAWLHEELKKRNCPSKDALLFTVDCTGKIFFVRRE